MLLCVAGAATLARCAGAPRTTDSSVSPSMVAALVAARVLAEPRRPQLRPRAIRQAGCSG